MAYHTGTCKENAGNDQKTQGFYKSYINRKFAEKTTGFSQDFIQGKKIKSKRKMVKLEAFTGSASKERVFAIRFPSLTVCKRLFVEKTGIDPKKRQ